MSGISAIISFKRTVKPGQLEEMLLWNRPAYASLKGASTITNHQNISIGSYDGEEYYDAEHQILCTYVGTLFRDKTKTASHFIKQFINIKAEAFKELDGDFVLFVLDKTTNELYVVRDRVGIYPLYWHIHANSGYFSSSLKAILSTGAISPTCDLAGIASFLGLGFISQDATAIEEVNRLLPGYYLKVQASGSFSIAPYWSYSSAFHREQMTHFDSSFDIYCELERHITASIKKTDLNRLSYLEGTLGAYIVGDTLQDKMTPLSVSLTPKDFIKGLPQCIWAQELPNATFSTLESWKYVVACKEQNLAASFDTGFSAEFYDYSKEAQEIFQTHYHVSSHYEETLFDKLHFRFRPKRYLNKLRKMQVATPLMAFLEPKRLFSAEDFAASAPELSRHFQLDLFIEQFYNLKRIAKLDASLFYLTIKSSVTDGLSESRLRLSQNHGVTSISPFLDWRLLEFFGSIAPEVWASPDLIAGFPNFWRSSHEKGDEIALLPREVGLASELLLSKEIWRYFTRLEHGILVETGLVMPSWIKKALQAPKAHLKSLWALLVLEVWMKLFIDLPLKEANKELTLDDLMG